MQKITVEITAKGYKGLTAENIEKALNYYFGSRSLGVSFSVTEVAQQSVQADETWGCPMCDAEWPAFRLTCACGYPRPSRR